MEEEMISGVEFRSSSGVLDSGVEPQSSGLNNVDTGAIIINRKEVDRLVRCLYGSHFLSRWGDRWCSFLMFGIVLILCAFGWFLDWGSSSCFSSLNVWFAGLFQVMLVLSLAGCMD
jgi:hypothetical protein